MMDHTLSGWLFKLSTTNKLGSSKWQSRYFVLLDTELRYYKHEHSVDPSCAISLHEVSRVVKTSTFNHNYCFKLETTTNYKQRHAKRQKTWTMECHSEYELDVWFQAINARLTKLRQYHSLPCPSNVKPRSFKRSNLSISRRRGIVLSPLEFESMPVLDHETLSSSSSSKASTIPSPNINTSETYDSIIQQGCENQAANFIMQHDYTSSSKQFLI